MRMHIKILSRYVEAFGGLTVLNTAYQKNTGYCTLKHVKCRFRN